MFTNQSGSRSIVDSLLVYPDPDTAERDRDPLIKSYTDPQTGAIKGGTQAPADVGIGGTIISGPSADGAKSVTSVIFREGKVIALIEFEGAPNDPVPPISRSMWRASRMSRSSPGCLPDHHKLTKSHLDQQQCLPRQAVRPSLTATAAITSATTGSAHDQPNHAFSSRPTSSTPDR